jgi:hypothetical protein
MAASKQRMVEERRFSAASRQSREEPGFSPGKLHGSRIIRFANDLRKTLIGIFDRSLATPV